MNVVTHHNRNKNEKAREKEVGKQKEKRQLTSFRESAGCPSAVIGQLCKKKLRLWRAWGI